MGKTLIVCSILSAEVEKVLDELNINGEIRYIEGALHVDFDKMEKALNDSLGQISGDTQTKLIVGSKCHPNIENIAKDYGACIVKQSNCIEMLLGEEKLKQLNAECNTFFMTGGWLKNWHSIFCEGGLGWDSVDAKTNFGFYERILMLDTGLSEFPEEDIFEFFEYTGIPIEFYPVTLDHLKSTIEQIVLN